MRFWFSSTDSKPINIISLLTAEVNKRDSSKNLFVHLFCNLFFTEKVCFGTGYCFDVKVTISLINCLNDVHICCVANIILLTLGYLLNI